MITINPHERELYTVFLPLVEGHHVEVIHSEHQRVTIQRDADGGVYHITWTTIGVGDRRAAEQFAMDMGHYPANEVAL